MNPDNGRIALIGPEAKEEMKRLKDIFAQLNYKPEVFPGFAEAARAGYTERLDSFPKPCCPTCKGKGVIKRTAGKKIKFKACKCTVGG